MRDVQELLEGNEGPRLDFKRDLSSTSRVVRTLAAMGNTAGGHVVIGVDNDGTIPGLADPLKDEEALSRAVADSVEPLLPVEISVQHVGTANVLVAEALRWKGPFAIKAEGEKGFYKRVGSTNQRLGSTEIDELRREISGTSFDAMPRPGTSRDDLDPTRLRSYLREQGIKTGTPRLRSLELLAEYAGGSVVASNAGLILFGKNSSRGRLVPDARVRCARFRGTSSTATRSQTGASSVWSCASPSPHIPSSQRTMRVVVRVMRVFVRVMAVVRVIDSSTAARCRQSNARHGS
jgi:ATP-dependent DNA helicase RecG